ncbi:MAG: DMT family transporter [Pseudomonadota bacterium]
MSAMFGSTEPRRESLAVAAILITVATLSFSDALVKLFSDGFSLWQIFTLRSLCVAPLLVAALALQRSRSERLRRPLFWVSIRSLLMAAQAILYYLALPKVALSAVAATNYTMPLFVTMFAAVIFGHRVPLKAWIAVGLGFSGVLLIVQPASSTFNAFALLPLVAAMLAALANLVTNAKCQDVPPLVISLNLNLVLLAVGLLGTCFGLLPQTDSPGSDYMDYVAGRWTPMTFEDWAAILIMAVSFAIGSIGAAVAYQFGRPTTIATLDFMYIAFAFLWGLLFFSELPNVAALLGIVIIVVSGLVVVRR